ncbi:MAG: hypothetical protein ABSF50_05685 [Burkholderiaceae bacterium]|jgi:hypothetical protein
MILKFTSSTTDNVLSALVLAVAIGFAGYGAIASALSPLVA